MKKKPLKEKIQEAEKRTRHWARGVNLEFPEVEAEERLAEELRQERKIEKEKERLTSHE